MGAALQASSLGLSTALIERRSVVAPLTRACSEGLLHDEFYFGDSITVHRDTASIDFNHAGLSLAYSGETYAVPAFINISRSNRHMRMVREAGLPIHLVFDKARYLEENLRRAVDAGIVFLPGHTVVGVDTNDGGVTVQTHRDRFRARFLIAADGHNSMCARFAGFDRDRKFYGTLTAACWHITGFEPPERAHMHLLEGADDPSVFCVCPRVAPDEWSVVISGFTRAPDYQRRFAQVQTASPLAQWFRGVRIQRRLACVLNLYEPLADPCGGNVFVVGDGAWFGQTSNTHAALTGAKAVECIGKALQERRTGDAAYEPYRRWWTENFTNYIRTPGGANMFEILTAAEIDRLFSYMPAEIPASLEPKKCSRSLGEFFQKLLPEISKEDPAFVEKIVAVQQRSIDEAWREKRKAGFPVRECPEQGSHA